jgi:hypothetical protein
MGTLATPAVSATAPRTIVADPNETPETFGVERYFQTVRTNSRRLKSSLLVPVLPVQGTY